MGRQVVLLVGGRVEGVDRVTVTWNSPWVYDRTFTG